MFVEKDGEKYSFITQLKVIYNFINAIKNANLNGVAQEKLKKNLQFKGKEFNSIMDKSFKYF